MKSIFSLGSLFIVAVPIVHALVPATGDTGKWLEHANHLWRFDKLDRYNRLHSREEVGWLSRWLNVGGEGAVTVFLGESNFTLPHRPAAFPAHLNPPTDLPTEGYLSPFHRFLNDSSSGGGIPVSRASSNLACLPPIFPPVRFELPSKPYKIALIERGGCDFAQKVIAAQERGAAGVIIGDGIARPGETEEEGRERDSLITMFSPEDTDGIFIPSVFVSRSSYLLLRDLLDNITESGPQTRKLWIEISEGHEEGAALSSLLSFALLMPSLFLLTTIAIHRFRVARQREADRAPPLIVLSLPERIWTPDIVWEKPDSAPASPSATGPSIPPPPPISPSDILTPPAINTSDPLNGPAASTSKTADGSGGHSSGKRYFSKDECAICMDSFQRGEVVRILPCGHVFHKEECDEWLMKWRKLCPTCRADVTIPPPGSPNSDPITPVVDPTSRIEPEPGRGDHDSFFTPVVVLYHRIRDTFTAGRGRLRLADGDSEAGLEGERTPLMTRSPARSPRTRSPNTIAQA